MDDHRGALCLGAKELAGLIRQAEVRVVLTAPGLQLPVAEALAAAQGRIPCRVLVVLDPAPALLRLGYGELAAVEHLVAAVVPLHRHEGLRLGCLVVDDDAFFFTPTPLLVEAEPDFAERRNGFRLQAEEAFRVLRSIAGGDALEAALKGPMAGILAPPPGETTSDALLPEAPSTPVSAEEIAILKQDLAVAPPRPFDVSRQVNVYQAHLLYVELELEGCQFQKRKFRIPQELHPASPDPAVQAKFETSFLIDVSSQAASTEAIEACLNGIRRDLARDLRYPFGRVVLRRQLPDFEAEVDRLQKLVAEAQKKVEAGIETLLKASLDQVVDKSLPLFLRHPPPGTWNWGDSEEARAYLHRELSRTFPTATDLARKMKLHVFQRDLTYDTLKNPELLARLKKAFPEHPWDRAHAESVAAAARKKA